MPFRSRTSLASGTGSSIRPSFAEKRRYSSADDEMLSDSEKQYSNARSPLRQEALTMTELPTPVSASSSKGRPKKNTRIREGLRIYWARFRRRLGSGTAPSTSSAMDDSAGESSGPSSRTAPVAVIPDDADDSVDAVVVDREWSDEIKSSSVTHSEHGGSPDKSGGSHPVGGTNTDRDSFVQHDGFWPWIYLRWRLYPSVYRFFNTRFMDDDSERHYRRENWFLRKNIAIWSAIFYIVNWALAVAFIPRPVVAADQAFYYAVAPVLSFPVFFMILWDWPRDHPIFYQIWVGLSTWQWGLYNLIFIYLCGHYDQEHSRFTCGGKDFLTLFYYTSALQTIAIFGLKLQRFPAMVGAICFLGLTCGLIVPLRTSFIRNVVNFLFFQGFLLYIHYMRENAERKLYSLREQLKIQHRATQRAQVNERKAADSKRRLTSCVPFTTHFIDWYSCHVRLAMSSMMSIPPLLIDQCRKDTDMIWISLQVRVPLNTALLAVQNMEASGVIAKTQEIEFKALEGSLSMMSKVLNDVLDFNRMDSGRFESVLKPYTFHQVLRSLFIPLQLATDARGLEFVKDLDHNIDDIARLALYESLGLSEEVIEERMKEKREEDAIVVGDETRFRQIITNLASNACKFTPTGGKLVIRTKLVLPHLPCPHESQDSTAVADNPAKDVETIPASDDPDHVAKPDSTTSPVCQNQHQPLSRNHLIQHDRLHSKSTPLEWIVVRMEISDTGCGIRSKDMKMSKLFSAFNQTEQGRQQGGKGTGLGLALVRQIVKLSGGRLGLKSKVDEGSTFWVELPLGVGTKAQPGMNMNPNPRTREPDVSRHPRSSSRTNEHPSGSGKDGSRQSPSRPPSAHRNNGTSDANGNQGPASRSSSALHSIMEQGGLVEISTKRGESAVPTRTLGDSSTGTDPNHAPAKERPSPSPAPSLAERRAGTSSDNSSDTVKPPHHLKLPKPQRFSLDDPILDVSPSDSAGTSSPPQSQSSTPSFEPGLRVLVVDDDPLTRKLMSRMLTRLGCRVYTAENGGIALEMILGTWTNRPTPSSEDTGCGGLSTLDPTEEYKFSVIFLDNQMPVCSGLEAVAKLRNMGRRDFVVGVTGNALLTDQQEYLDAGVDHVLTKPVYEKSLKGMLSIADDRRKRGSPGSERPEPLMSSSPTS
ncbi:hypothetical protein QCA50_011086 [Cerrena zonata]|uniref:histidine kinase n=1 Tax=Cerrena zonata TaxID=2478898 RepID=A0AAW0FX12_9APHY